MDINGCHIVSVLNADSPDGFAATVSRWVGHRSLDPFPPPEAVKVSKGPFLRQREAIKYAHIWSDADNPPAMVPHADLEVNGCVISTIADTAAPDGVISSVARKPEDPKANPIVKGPFRSLLDAVDYAKAWTDPTNPPAVPKPDVELEAVEVVQAEQAGESPSTETLSGESIAKKSNRKTKSGTAEPTN